MKTSLMRSDSKTKYLVKCRRNPLEINRKFRRRSFTSSRKNEICNSRPNHAVTAKKWCRRKKTSVLPPSGVAWVRVPVSTLYVGWVCCWISPLLYWEVLIPGIPVYTSTKKPNTRFHVQTNQVNWPRIRYPVPGIQNPWSGIPTPRLSWIPLHEASCAYETGGFSTFSLPLPSSLLHPGKRERLYFMTPIHGFCIQNYVNFQYKAMELLVSEKLFVPLNVYRPSAAFTIMGRFWTSWRRQVLKLYTLFKSQDPENYTLWNGRYPSRLNKGVTHTHTPFLGQLIGIRKI